MLLPDLEKDLFTCSTLLIRHSIIFFINYLSFNLFMINHTLLNLSTVYMSRKLISNNNLEQENFTYFTYIEKK